MMRFFLLFFLAGLVLSSHAQQQPPLAQGYYVIVGAFAVRDNAEKFNASLNTKGLNTSYGYVPSRQLYYVYTLRNEQVTPCTLAARELRKESQFSDAWVRYINEKYEDEPVAGGEESATNELPVVKEPEPAGPENNATPKEEVPIETETETADGAELTLPDKITLGNTEVFLSLYNAANDRVVEGKVQVVDTDRGRLIQEVPGNTYLTLPDPKSTSGKISLICDAFGYRKLQKDINFNNPMADSVLDLMGTALVANFELVRYSTGDIRTLYHVYFFNDAAVMMPESKFELNEILVMMKENESTRIRLHGHTNGNYHGKIIKVGPSGNFFSVEKDANTTIGSAKELSESRAQVIKDYLVANGIHESRIEVKAWGGKRPLYDKHSPNAKKNIRVEVEIL